MIYSIIIDSGELRLEELSADDLAEVTHAAMDAEAELVREHLENLPGRSYYSEAAASIERESSEGYEAMHINKAGFALQLFGGQVMAGKGSSSKTGKPTKYLSIPANKGITEAPGFYSGLVMMRNKKGSRWLAIPHKDGTSTPYFWLKEKVSIPAHPQNMPSEQRLQEAAQQGAEEYLVALSYLA